MERRKKKKIIYIGAFRNLWDEEGNARAFESLGHEVTRIAEENFDFNGALLKIKKIRPDFILFAKFKVPALKDEFMRSLENYTTVCWHFDLYFSLPREGYLRTDPIFRADYVFTPDGGNDARFKKLEINHTLLRQGIHKEYCYRGEFTKELDCDVAFVGCQNNNWMPRMELCRFLGENYDFKWFGRTNTLDIRGHELNKLYASAKIVVGDSIYSPYYWSNRIYETLGRGGFMIHMEIPGLEEDYTPYKHYIPYKLGDFGGLKEKIDYFLTKPDERRKISQSALEHTKKNHILERRCKKLLHEIHRGKN